MVSDFFFVPDFLPDSAFGPAEIDSRTTVGTGREISFHPYLCCGNAFQISGVNSWLLPSLSASILNFCMAENKNAAWLAIRK